MIGRARRDAIAAGWLDYALRWAESRRRSEFRRGRPADAIDWEQVAILGLWDAARGFRPRGPASHPSEAFVRRCLRGAATGEIRKAARRAAKLARAPLRDILPGRECDPAFLAQLNEGP